MAQKNNNGLTAAIVFAGVAISGSLVFFGTQLGGGLNDEELQTQIFKGIDAYIEKQQGEYAAQQAEAAKPTPQYVEGDFSDDDPFMGDKDAPVTIVEWSDYECPYCTRFYEETLGDIEKNYVETGKVKFVYRDFPLSFHAKAYPAALLAECAREQGGDKVYFEIHNKIFEEGFDKDKLFSYAASIGVDEGGLTKCIEEDRYKEEIYADMDAGSAIGISGTPGFVVGSEVISGAVPYDVFEKAIEKALADAE
ncbi:DsbA family protein [Candidatus Peregrinibacteria bacterium]|nr:DsbA family protein [Candidatus Peregrinibacteria bacterium]